MNDLKIAAALVAYDDLQEARGVPARERATARLQRRLSRLSEDERRDYDETVRRVSAG